LCCLVTFADLSAYLNCVFILEIRYLFICSCLFYSYICAFCENLAWGRGSNRHFMTLVITSYYWGK
jgi:hypothetical protein